MIDSRKLSSYKDFKKVQLSNPKYWKEKRWIYSMVVMDMIKRLPYDIKTSLEIGSYNFKLIRKSLTMDKNKKADIKHNAAFTPYPIEGKAFDLSIALQVWEHLSYEGRGSQQKAFKELKRVSKNIILSFPYLWKNVPKDNCHYMISKKIIKEWTCEIPPAEIIQVDNRLIYRWDFN